MSIFVIRIMARKTILKTLESYNFPKAVVPRRHKKSPLSMRGDPLVGELTRITQGKEIQIQTRLLLEDEVAVGRATRRVAVNFDCHSTILEMMMGVKPISQRRLVVAVVPAIRTANEEAQSAKVAVAVVPAIPIVIILEPWGKVKTRGQW